MTAERAQRIHESFDRWLEADPDRRILLLPTRSLTFAELDRMVERAVAELLSLGVKEADRVLIVAENCPEHVALLLACSRLGLWSCGVNARMSPGEISSLYEKADACVAYFTTGVSAAAREHALTFGAVPSALEGLERSTVRGSATTDPGPDSVNVAAIIFTSGTTGQPKGVLVTHAGLLQFAKVSARARQLNPQDRVFACLPMTHIFGLGTILTTSLCEGVPLVMRSGFSPADALQALAHEGVTNLLGPPTLFSRLLAFMDSEKIAGPVAPQLRYLYTGAGPLDLGLKRKVEGRFGLTLHHGYGLSEYAGSLHVTSLDAPRHDTSPGQVVDGAELRIVDPEGNELPTGDRGEIWIRGIGLTPGYFRDQAATSQAMRPAGWYATGDLGYLDQDGALFVVGRLKEMIVRSGFKVYPAEVEAVLNAFPGIQLSAVVGVPEADGNEEVRAFVECRPGMHIDEAELQAYLRHHLAPYKRPSRVVQVAIMPMTSSGKILKRELVTTQNQGGSAPTKQQR